MNAIEVNIMFYALDKLFNQGTMNKYGSSKAIHITTNISVNATVADLFNLPGIILPQGDGVWQINGRQIEDSSTALLSEYVSDNKVRLTLIRKCDGCLLSWDDFHHRWDLVPANV